MKQLPGIGFHAPIKDGLHESLIIAKETGCDAVQIFSRNPRAWMAKPLTKEAVKLFRKTRRQTKLSPVLIHTNYLINLAAADETILLRSIPRSVKKSSERSCSESIISWSIPAVRADQARLTPSKSAR